MMYSSWDMEHVGQNFFIILDHFLPFYTPNNLKIKILKNLKKDQEISSFLQWCSKNHDHMLYCSWYMAHNRCNLFFILGHFFLFYLFNSLKNQNEKKWKKKKSPGDISILQWCTKNHDHMLYEILCITDVTVIFHFGLSFALLPP